MLLVIRKYSEAGAMVSWGIRIAEALGSPLNILWLEHGGEVKQAVDLEWKSWADYLSEESDSDWSRVEKPLENRGELEVNICKESCKSRHLTILSVERSMSPVLIVVGRLDFARDGSMTGKLAREILDDAHCVVLVIRLSLIHI